MLNTSLSLSLCVCIQVNEDLVGALARANRADVIRELHLYTGASLDSTDGEGLTALHHAVLEGHLQAVKTLIQAFLFFTTNLVPNFLHTKRVSGQTRTNSTRRSYRAALCYRLAARLYLIYYYTVPT
jgi:ankyrin repeat protein